MSVAGDAMLAATVLEEDLDAFRAALDIQGYSTAESDVEVAAYIRRARLHLKKHFGCTPHPFGEPPTGSGFPRHLLEAEF